MMNEADILCDRIGIIDHGKIVSLDTPTNLKNSISGANTTILILEIANLKPDLINNSPLFPDEYQDVCLAMRTCGRYRLNMW